MYLPLAAIFEQNISHIFIKLIKRFRKLLLLLLLESIYIAPNILKALGAEHSTILNFDHRNIQGTPVQTRRS